MTLHHLFSIGFALSVAGVMAGCGEAVREPGGGAAIVGGAYLLDEEPAGAKDVLDALASAKDGEKVTVVGRIGGAPDPWVTDVAAFHLVDTSLTPCNERGEDDGCEIPWDYCCEPDLATSKTFVKVVDANGEVVATGAKDLLGVKELQTVVVKGKAQRVDDKSLTVLADKVYVKKP